MNQTAYLQAMGIDIWQVKPSDVKNNIISYQLLDKTQNVFGYLFANVEPGSASDAQSLAQKIAESIALQVLSVDAEAAKKNIQPHSILVLLGNIRSISMELKAMCQALQCVSVQEILKNPALKSQVWQQLKPIAVRFK